MQISFYGGINEIGGNKIFIKSGEKTFCFDFGLSFRDMNQYFSTFLNPRKLNGIIDYLYLGLIPAINKIYRNDFINPFKEKLMKGKYNIVPSKDNLIDASFLTHAHLDHCMFLGFFKQNTPIYINWLTESILDYLDESSSNPLVPNMLHFYEAFKLVPKKKTANGEIEYKRARKGDYKKQDITRNINIINPGEQKSFNTVNGKVIITQYLVDHSIPGSCAYIIEEDGRSIIYTGDFRRHGMHQEWVENFIIAAKKSNPIAIISEGTRVPSIDKYKSDDFEDDSQSEDEVKRISGELIGHHDDLILFNCPSRNLDRILLYYELAKKNNRILAITPKIHIYLEWFKKKLATFGENEINEFYKNYDIPEYNDDYLSVYLPRKGWGRFESQDYKKYERNILNDGNYINHKNIKVEPEKYLMYLDYFMMNELIDLDQRKDSILFINSTTDPFNEEMVIQEKKLNAWLNKFGVIKTETIHSSGHVNVDDLIHTLSSIQPDSIIPVHTENPETFKEFGLSSNIIIPQKRKVYFF